ncbi:MAG: phage holin family protein [Clostridiales bacterium]|nr:phage holin family protein [Clostridiales bacterium]
MKYFGKWLACVLAVLVGWKAFPSHVAVDGIWYLLAAGTVLWIANAFLRPVVRFVSFPLTLLTLGLFSLVINALMVLFAAYLLPGFAVSGFWAAAAVSVIASACNVLLASKDK